MIQNCKAISDADSLAIAMPGFNKALKLIADLRDARKMLPTTIENYLNFYELVHGCAEHHRQ